MYHIYQAYFFALLLSCFKFQFLCRFVSTFFFDVFLSTFCSFGVFISALGIPVYFRLPFGAQLQTDNTRLGGTGRRSKLSKPHTPHPIS